MQKAISLTELIIAVTLMSVIILGATVFDTSSRKFMNSSERKTVVTNELHLVLDYMQKDAGNRTTLFTAVAVGAGQGLRMFQDLAGTPWVLPTATSSNVTYVFGNVATTSVERCDSTGACITLSRRFVAPAFSIPVTVPAGYRATLTTPTVRYNPAAAVDNSTNPQVTVPTVNFYVAEKGRS